MPDYIDGFSRIETVCTLLPFPSRTYCPNCGEEIDTEDPYWEDNTLECPNCGYIIQEA